MILKPPKGKLLNRSHWMSRGLVGCWLFNLHPQVLGQAFDYANGNHGTLVSDTHSVPGKFGNALDFEPVADYVAHNADSGSYEAITMLAWIRAESITGEDTIYLERYNELSFKLRFLLNAGKVKGSWRDGQPGTTANVESATAISVGVWTQVAVTFDSRNNSHAAYINGMLAGTSSTAVSVLETDWFPGQIGNQDTTPRPFDGQIDYVSIYNRALSAGEVLSLYRNPFQMFEGSGL